MKKIMHEFYTLTLNIYRYILVHMYSDLCHQIGVQEVLRTVHQTGGRDGVGTKMHGNEKVGRQKSSTILHTSHNCTTFSFLGK